MFGKIEIESYNSCINTTFLEREKQIEGREQYEKIFSIEYKNLNELEKVLKKEIARETQSVETVEQLEIITCT